MPTSPRAPRLAIVPGLLAVILAACGGTSGASTAPSETPEASDEASTAPTIAPPPSEAAEPSEAAPSEAPSVAPASSAAGADELDWQLPPNFGSVELVSGFTPDPHEEPMTSGGSIDASYLGGDCRGWATAEPDFDVTYEAGSLTLLRFYFVADEDGADTTIIINAPDGEWYCNDDAAGTFNPMFDFTNPTSGLYDIWIGSYEEGTNVEGVLHITELSSNTP